MIATKPGTERLTLKRTDWPDVDNIVALYADVEVMRHRGDGRPMGPAQVLSHEMPRLMAHNNRQDYLGCWTARERETGAFVGWFMIVPAASGEAAELSFRLRRTGHAYDVEGVREMVLLAQTAQVGKVVASVAHDDEGSRRVLGAAGFRPAEATDSTGDQALFVLQL